MNKIHHLKEFFFNILDPSTKGFCDVGSHREVKDGTGTRSDEQGRGWVGRMGSGKGCWRGGKVVAVLLVTGYWE